MLVRTCLFYVKADTPPGVISINAYAISTFNDLFWTITFYEFGRIKNNNFTGRLTVKLKITRNCSVLKR